jgi:hypothetical protein
MTRYCGAGGPGNVNPEEEVLKCVTKAVSCGFRPENPKQLLKHYVTCTWILDKYDSWEDMD